MHMLLKESKCVLTCWSFLPLGVAMSSKFARRPPGWLSSLTAFCTCWPIQVPTAFSSGSCGRPAEHNQALGIHNNVLQQM
jgi:hypothetical protein